MSPTVKRQAIFQIVETARQMLAGTIGPIEGSRLIARRYPDVGCSDPSYYSFLAISSESDTLVVGEDRSLWAQAYLDEMDRRYAAYAATLDIAADCEAVIAMLEPKLKECPVCGFSALETPPYDAEGEPSHEVCPCCNFQPGVTDESGYDVTAWRKRWIADGMPFCHAPMPVDWDAAAQLCKAGLTVR